MFSEEIYDLGGMEALRGTWMAWGVVAAAALGCRPSAIFLCESDADCQDGGRAGQCQPSGYCSFPDESCESGQRYGDLAAGVLANACVELEPSTEGPPSSTSADPSTSSPETTTATTISSLDGTEASDSGSGSSSTTDAPGSTSTTGTVSGCFIDEFDDGVIDAYWCLDEEPGISLFEEDGRLWAELQPAEWGSGGTSSFVEACDSFVLEGSSAEVRVDVVPDVMPNGTAFLELGNEQGRLALSASVNNVYALVWDGAMWQQVFNEPNTAERPYDWRITGTPEGLVGERSINGGAWEEVYVYATDTSVLGNARIGVFGLDQPMAPSVAGFDRAEICEAR